MSKLIDIVAPPFPGHLFPLLDLAQGLRERGLSHIRILTTAKRRNAVELCGLEFVELLAGEDHFIDSIGNADHRIGANPFRLYSQFCKNMSLMDRLREELREIWSRRRPAVAIVDFTVPLAGILAQQLGIPWWTSCVSPVAIETRNGVPSYLGGWRPRNDLLGRIRDQVGRAVTRSFKRTVGLLFRRPFRRWGIDGVYRADGSEVAYSNEWIMGCGLPEFEFGRDWPSAFEFIGPLTGGPPLPFTPPEFEPNRQHILVSLGTHVPWAKELLRRVIPEVAKQLPELQFHVSGGKPGGQQSERLGNIQFVDYFPYDQFLHRYAAGMVHGGTGVVYSCIRAAVPMLVAPQDFDHFDHATRIVERKLGEVFSLKENPTRIAAKLRALLLDSQKRKSIESMRQKLENRNPYESVASRIQSLKNG